MYDFDRIVDRRNTDSLKWEVADNELPMWVADMDFQAAPEIQAALLKRLEQGIYGYSIIPEEWQQAYIGWWKRRHDFLIEKEWLLFSTGVIPIISSAVRKLTTPGENVLIQTPVYNMFYNCIRNNGRNILENPLRYQDGAYSIDFDDLEEKLADPQTTLMILCNPHNPVGKIWNKKELEKVGTLCEKHHVIVISDEIHCDLTAPGKEYIPFASVSECCKNSSITCVAPTKTFNLAGLKSAAAFVPNEALRHKIWSAINTDEVAAPNYFAVTAAIAAFEQGEDWLQEAREYIQKNKELVIEHFKKELPQLSVVSTDATYLLWLDCGSIADNTDALAAKVRKTTGLFLTAGSVYGETGKRFLRWNVACPEATMKDGLQRLTEGVKAYMNM